MTSTKPADVERSTLESIVEQIQSEHRLRRDVRGTLTARQFRHRPRPKTAIIARAAAESIAAKEWADGL